MKTEPDERFEIKDDPDFDEHLYGMIYGAVAFGMLIAVVVICCVAYFISWLNGL